MKLVVGLGNPEPEYSNTRHNVGKDFLNFYIENHFNSLSGFKNDSKLKAQVLKFNQEIIFAKPTVYMNDSGDSVSRLMSYYKLEVKDLCVVYDELDLTVGSSKLSFISGSKIHNGISSIIDYIKSAEFYHLRIGVRGIEIPMSVKKFGYDPKTYVLAKFTKEDKSTLQNHFSNELVKLLDSFLSK